MEHRDPRTMSADERARSLAYVEEQLSRFEHLAEGERHPTYRTVFAGVAGELREMQQALAA